MSYQTQYLSDVIMRVDFISPQESIKKSLDAEVKNIAVKHFPILENRSVETQQVLIKNEPGMQNTILNKEQFFEWHFFGKEREKELCICNNCMFIAVKKYTSYEDLKMEFFEILNVLLQRYTTIRINRVGLRYVNQINLPPEKKSRKNWNNYWGKYIKDSLIKGLTFPDCDSAIARHMTTIEMNYGDYMLRFQYGIFNEDFPAPNKKNTFVIDTDVYVMGLIEEDDVKKYSDLFHEKANEWFEESIKEPLKEKMRKGIN